MVWEVNEKYEYAPVPMSRGIFKTAVQAFRRDGTNPMNRWEMLDYIDSLGLKSEADINAAAYAFALSRIGSMAGVVEMTEDVVSRMTAAVVA